MSEPKKEWPKTAEEAVERLLSSMSEKDKEVLRKTPKTDLINFHFSLGAYIRNNFGLWQGNDELLKSMRKSHFPFLDPDGASMIIIELLWESLQKP